MRIPIVVPAQFLEFFESLIEFFFDIDQRDVVREIVEPCLYLLCQLEIRIEHETILAVLNQFV